MCGSQALIRCIAARISLLLLLFNGIVGSYRDEENNFASGRYLSAENGFSRSAGEYNSAILGRHNGRVLCIADSLSLHFRLRWFSVCLPGRVESRRILLSLYGTAFIMIQSAVEAKDSQTVTNIVLREFCYKPISVFLT